MSKKITGFKAFDKGLKCRNFQYEVGKTYEEKEAVICGAGFHFCTNPFDLLRYYDLCDSEFAEVESTGSVDRCNSDSKIATTKITIKAVVGLTGWVNSAISFLIDFCKTSKERASGDSAQMAASGDYAQMAASGYSAKMAASGDYAQMAASGEYAQMAASGYSAKMAASGDYAQMAASGYSAKMAASGYSAQMAASGDSAQMAASGDSAQMAASGDSAQMAASGDSAQMAASGDSAQMAASGYSAKMEITGVDSVCANIGIGGMAKGKKGNWITLAEWRYCEDKERHIPLCVKSAQIDGEVLKEDVFYKLINGKFDEDKKI